MPTRLFLSAAVVLCLSAPLAAQLSSTLREQAKPPYENGLEEMRREALAEAIKSFERAVAIDPGFEMAHYMLGRVHLMQRNYTPAVHALKTARDLFNAQSTEQFTNKQERQRVIRQRIADIDQLIVDYRAAAGRPENRTRAHSLLEQARQYEERRRQLQDMMREDDLSPTRAVPGFVTLSLGSAYFRSGKLAEAEEAYLAAVAADPKIGEAHNNLAVVYMETGRLDKAEKALQAAEKTGLRVNPALKAEIEKRKRSGTQ